MCFLQRRVRCPKSPSVCGKPQGEAGSDGRRRGESGVGCLELGDEVSRDPAASAAAAAGAASGAAGGGDVGGERVPQCLGVLFGQIDLVVLAVQTEPDGLALPVRDGLAVQVIGELDNSTL